jgi:hypothetical protein
VLDGSTPRQDPCSRNGSRLGATGHAHAFCPIRGLHYKRP